MSPSEEEKSRKTLWVFWGAFTYASFFYGVIGYWVRCSARISVSGELSSMLIPVFIGLALMETIVLFLLMPRFAQKTSYSSYCILRWALAGSIGVYGFVLFVLGASWVILAIFLGWALLLNLILMPTQNDRDKFEQLSK